MKCIKLWSVGATLFLLLQIASAFSIYNRAKRSKDLTCKQELVDNLAKIANESCSQVEAVDKYVSEIQSRNQVPVPSFSDRHGFKAILGQYNADLETAQGHCHTWRNGDNVVASLKQVVLAVQGFEPNFNAELVRNEARIKYLLKNHKNIAEIEAKIVALQRDIARAKEAIKATEVQAVVYQLENIVKTKEEEINTTMKEHNIAKGRHELAELLKYMEFVKEGAMEIETNANATNTKLISFKENINKDAGVFRRHRTIAQDGINRIQQENQNNNIAINRNRKNIENLRTKINQENKHVSSANSEIAQAQSEINEIEARINIKMMEASESWFIGFLFPIVMPGVGDVVGPIITVDAEIRLQEQANEKRHYIDERNQRIETLQARISTHNREISRYQQEIKSFETRNQELEQELQHFNQLDSDFHSLEIEVKAILPSIVNAFIGVEKMKATFNGIEQNLGNAIRFAKQAKTEAEIRNMSYFIYNEINDMKCKWENARNKIVLVGKCN